MKFLQYIMVALVFNCATSCVEEIDFQTENFESILVVDATITNEEKFQQIYLSRTFEFGEEEIAEENAQVQVLGNGIEYLFEEILPGTYQSKAPFRAEANIDYQLNITTSNGSKYSSKTKQLTTPTQIDNLYANRITNDDGVDGIAILADSFDPTNTANYYRYSFEETYKIVAPMWRNIDTYVISFETPLDPLLDTDFVPCLVGLTERPENQKVCFNSEFSTNINLASTSQLNESRIEGHLVHFLANDNYKISHRYSILVEQAVLSEEAFTYYQTIQSFTTQGSLFSQVQTGFVIGNISSVSNPDEKVIGVFDVVAVTSQRLYFNYEDFYPDTELPPYIIACTLSAPSPIIRPDGSCGPLINLVDQRFRVYLRDYSGEPAFAGDTGPYLMIPQACGDCTALGEPEPPDFWVE